MRWPESLRPKRLRFLFTLRTLMVAVSVAVFASAWFAMKVGDSRARDRAITGIMRAGGHLTYAYEWQGAEFNFSNKYPVPVPRTPQWLARLTGTRVFDYPVTVSLRSRKWNDDALVHVSALHDVQAALLGHGMASDQTLQQLRELDDLKVLELMVMKNVSDAGLKVLPEMASLTNLRMQGTHYTDEALVHIGRVRTLKKLTITFFAISDEGLRHLGDLRGLEQLSVQRCQHVTPEGVDWLRRKLPNCKIFLSY